MQLIRKFMILALSFAFATQSIYGQPCCAPEYEECECGDAYSQSSWTAHWSVYIPIALIVGAGIWFGVADSSSSGCESSSYSGSSYEDGLGSMGSRSSSSRSSSYSSSSSSRSSSHSSKSYSPSSFVSRSSSSYHCHCR